VNCPKQSRPIAGVHVIGTLDDNFMTFVQLTTVMWTIAAPHRNRHTTVESGE
jgi:hypothetical protein